MATFNLIQTITVGSGGAASIDFTSIPQGYKDLKVLFSGRSEQNVFSFRFTFNNDTTDYSTRVLIGDGSTAASDNNGDTTFLRAYAMNPSTYTADVFNNAEIYIPNYSGSFAKTAQILAVNENNATESYMVIGAGRWNDTAAITSLKIFQSGADIAEFSSASLYGIKNT